PPSRARAGPRTVIEAVRRGDSADTADSSWPGIRADPPETPPARAVYHEFHFELRGRASPWARPRRRSRAVPCGLEHHHLVGARHHVVGEAHALDRPEAV